MVEKKIVKKTVTKSNTTTPTTTATITKKKSTTTTTTPTTTTKKVINKEKEEEINKIVNNNNNNENDKFKIGKKIEIEITEIREFEIISKIDNEYIGKLHVCNILTNEETEQGQSILLSNGGIKRGKSITCYIVSVDNVAKILQLSMYEQPKPQTRQFKVGQQVDAIVYGKTCSNEITCWISPTQIAIIDIVSNFKDLVQLKKIARSNNYLKCFIKSLPSSGGNNDGSVENKIYLSFGKESISNEKLTVGNKMIGLITEVGVLALKVQLYNNLSGQIRLIDINEEIRTNPLSIYKSGELIMVCVKSIGGKDGILLSTYKSLLSLPVWEMNPKYKHPRAIKRSVNAQFSIGSEIWGYVIEKTAQIVRVELKGQLIAIVQVEEIGPFFIHLCEPGSLVKIVLSGEPTTEGSTQVVKAQLVTGKSAITSKNIKTDDILPLEVVEIKPYGLFVRNKTVSGLAHISELDDEPIDAEQIEKQFTVGDFVIGKCIGKDYSKEKRKNLLKFSLKQQHFTNIDMESFFKCSWDQPDPVEQIFEPLKPIQLVSILPIKSLLLESSNNNNNKTTSSNKLSTINEEDEEQQDDDDDEFKSSLLSTSTLSSKKRKEMENDEDEEMIDEDEVTSDKKKLKSEKNKNKNKQEKEIQEREDLLADHNVAPEGPQDFERMLLGSPNSSYLWIKFMSYYLGLSEIGKAREIGERAIKKIIPTEVLEQRNIWTALYNLENLYGTSETLLKLFQRSIQYQDAKTMYLTIINILESTGKIERTEEYFKMLFKKNGKHSAKVWCRYGEFLLKSGKLDVFNSILSKALEVLPKKKQIKVINKFAQLEYKLGDIERGRTIFEGLVSNYPNRSDIWNIYLDMELRNKDQIKSSKETKDLIRQLFNRTIALKVSDRNIKQFFKRFLQFEKEYGTTSTTNDVKKLAIKFVESNN